MLQVHLTLQGFNGNSIEVSGLEQLIQFNKTNPTDPLSQCRVFLDNTDEFKFIG